MLAQQYNQINLVLSIQFSQDRIFRERWANTNNLPRHASPLLL